MEILVIAGPNGAGKTTFASEYLPNEAGYPTFINADLIAQGISPFDPKSANVRAGRLMIEEIDRHVENRSSFSFETTLSGIVYSKKIPRWRDIGYTVKLFFLKLETIDQAIKRIEQRVAHGGHDIPVEVIKRRYVAGLKNFGTIYKGLVDQWMLFDNSGTHPILLGEGTNEF